MYEEKSTSTSRVVGGLLAAAAVLGTAVLTRAAAAGGSPTNDDCIDMIPIGLGAHPFDTTGALTDGPDDCSLLSSDIWFEFNSTFNGNLLVSTCGTANFDTILAVYKNCSCTSFNPIACNDENDDCDGNTSELTVEVDAGVCYKIRVGGFMNDEGSGILLLNCADEDNAACADHIVDGGNEGDRFGWAVANAGRIDNDTRDDLIVGAYLNDQTGTDTGRAYALAGVDLSTIDTFTGEVDGDQFGQAVAGGCDLDNDGFDDLIIGAPLNDENGENAGKIYVFSGADSSLIWESLGKNPGDKFGFSVACAGDVDDDGFNDVIAGAPLDDKSGTDAGRAFVFQGQDGTKIWGIGGKDEGDRFGHAVAPAGDIDEDGHADFVVGAPRNDTGGSDAGRVYIISGDDKSAIQRINGEDNGDQFGSALAAEQFTSGGTDFTYVLIGAPFQDFAADDAGAAYVYLANHEESECNNVFCLFGIFDGEDSGDRFGTSVSIGNVTGNSVPDLLIGAFRNNGNGSTAGRAYLINGSSGTQVRDFTGEAEGDLFGRSVAIVGDVDGDDVRDIAIGAPRSDAAAVDAGRVYIFLTP